MKHTKGYLIIDENDKYVVGYVKDDNKLRYIAYNKNEICSIKLIKTTKDATDYIKKLNKIANTEGEYHKFSYQEIY